MSNIFVTFDCCVIYDDMSKLLSLFIIAHNTNLETNVGKQIVYPILGGANMANWKSIALMHPFFILQQNSLILILSQFNIHSKS